MNSFVFLPLGAGYINVLPTQPAVLNTTGFTAQTTVGIIGDVSAERISETVGPTATILLCGGWRSEGGSGGAGGDTHSPSAAKLFLIEGGREDAWSGTEFTTRDQRSASMLLLGYF